MIQVDEKKDCCGCSACLQICPVRCISLKEDEEGFGYPVADSEKCIDCGLCEDVCPFIGEEGKKAPLRVYAVKNEDEPARLASSSGGMFTAFAEQVIAGGGVVFGAAFNEQYEVVHTYVESSEELFRLRGSKYAQSDINGTYERTETFLKGGRKVLFAGAPCQILALKRYLRKEYDNLFTVDFICHGVPGARVWNLYLNELLDKHLHSSLADVSEISFRDKFYGWKKFGFALHVQKGKCAYPFRLPLHLNAYMRGFLSNLYLRPSCYACKARGSRSRSDVTLGDYWGVRHVHPDFDDDKGVSVVLLNTEEATARFSSLKCEVRESTYDQALKYNAALEKSPEIPETRTVFYREWEKGVIPAIRKLTRMSWKERMKVQVLVAYYRINKLFSRAL